MARHERDETAAMRRARRRIENRINGDDVAAVALVGPGWGRDLDGLAGEYEVELGASSRDLRLRGRLVVE